MVNPWCIRDIPVKTELPVTIMSAADLEFSVEVPARKGLMLSGNFIYCIVPGAAMHIIPTGRIMLIVCSVLQMSSMPLQKMER